MDDTGTATRPDAAPDDIILHATAVALGKRGLLITGASGTGKSTLALELLAGGATLVADDRVCLSPRADAPPLMTPPAAIEGLIEARGVGLIRLPWTNAALTDALDLDRTEDQRLPDIRETVIADHRVATLRRVEHPAFAAMVLAYLKGERLTP